MYHAYWGMRCRPFDEAVRPAEAVPTEALQFALGKLRCALASGWPVVLAAGPAGSGKTLFLRLALAEAGAAGWRTALLTPSAGTLEDLGAALEADPRAEAVLAHLEAHAAAGGRTLIAVDDLHAFRDGELLACLREGCDRAVGGVPAVHLLLAGAGTKASGAAAALLSRVSMRASVGPLSAEDAKRYVLYRLKAAGCTRGIFTRHAADRLVELSGGVPRTLNRIGELSLMIGYGMGASRIVPEIVDLAADDLGLRSVARPSPVAARPPAPPAAEGAAAEAAAAEEPDTLAALVAPVPAAAPDEDVLASLPPA